MSGSDAMKRLRFRHNFSGSVEQLPLIRAFVIDSVAECGVGDEDLFACELAADEAAANVFHHAYADKPGAVEVEIVCEEETVLVRMAYRGKSFDPAHVPVPNVHEPLETRHGGGFGLYFMRQMMNDVIFEFDRERGNVLTMRRQLTQ